MASKQSKKPLPLKEQALFKELLSLYENRTLKRALKTADQILKKIPDHGETMCMKGLILTHMSRKEEGMELVKKGLVFDMQSHICWHVLGIIKKADKNWDEALKAYMQAVRCDKENLNLLRDTSQLQVHLGIYDGLQDTRWHTLKLRPNLRQNWIAYAVACHLNDNLVEAKNVLKTYIGTLLNVPNHDVEHSEILLYYLRVLEESGDYSDALVLLDTYAKERSIVDKVAIAEFRARLLSKSLQAEKAMEAWRILIDQNPDCHEYYAELFKLQGVEIRSPTVENYQVVTPFLEELSARRSKLTTPRRLLLTITPASAKESFTTVARFYLLNGFSRGIPSLFMDVRPLYTDEEKRVIIEDIVEGLREKIEKGETIADLDFNSDPTIYIWILYFLALHHSCGPYSSNSPLPDPNRSLSLINRAIEHTPTLPELYMGKAKILKIAGDPFQAARTMEEARRLDGQDRFLNWKAAKYLMRAGNIEEASRLLGLFTKKDALSPGADLEDMQCLSYMLAEGDAHLRAGRFGLALRRFKAVQMTFDDMENDQFDFHNFSLRKSTINTYLDLLSFEKNLRNRPTYIKAAVASSKIYVRLHDDPSLYQKIEQKASEADKKAKKKAKKVAKRAAEESKKPGTGAGANPSGKDEELPEPPKYEDPEGVKLLSTKSPLEDAMKWLKPLCRPKTQSLEVWFMIYDVAIRRHKFVQALQALISARKLGQSNPELHVRIVDFHIKVRALSAEKSQVAAVLATTDIFIPPEVSLETYNNEYIQKSSNQPKAILAGSRVSHLLGSPLDVIEGGIFELLSDHLSIDLQTARDGLDLLANIGSTRKDEFREKAKERFPLAICFGTEEDVRLAEEGLTVYMGSEPKSEEHST